MMLKKYIPLAALLCPALAFSFSVQEYTNKSTGEKSFYATSHIGKATTKMQPPYSDVSAKIHIACNDKNKHWAYVVFSTPPKINGAVKKEGYSIFSASLSFDKKSPPQKHNFKQELNSKAIFFGVPSYKLYENIASSSDAFLKLNWEGTNSITFKFPLKNSRAAINTALKKCGLNETKRK